MRKLYLFILAASLLTACNCDKQVKQATFVNRDMKVTSDVMTPEVLWSFGRVGNVSVSPDGKTVLLTVA
jgi:uncharacterized protein YcfL